VADERMPQAFFEKTDIYLEAYKKKFIHAKKAGNVDEYATDPIPMPVYELLLKWSIETSNVFAWFGTISQWNFMARSASIDPLAFHHFNLGVDSIIGKYDDSKADKIGERLHLCQPLELVYVLVDWDGDLLFCVCSGFGTTRAAMFTTWGQGWHSGGEILRADAWHCWQPRRGNHGSHAPGPFKSIWFSLRHINACRFGNCSKPFSTVHCSSR
jgi:hypothetical protein